ncbi:SycD/LcrH family type III secretion system chaperone [Serratia marcescens]|uniref:SycD/LcrH family type III secretion system chaperone n=1 Tax=Serratia marcescens TaxID=615 RepID=UPI00148C6B71|nr:SycD/LcrH family type III secretion system chaperone [Serratia marcescens]QJU42315.1 SycD/LcrH family type III secretion system chaperone [Serratia marcescens]
MTGQKENAANEVIFPQDVELKERQAVEDMLTAVLNEGVMLKDIHGISDEMMEQMYAHGHHFYENGRLDEAESFFTALCMYDLSNANYFVGLGAVNQLKKNYQKACDLYSLAYVMGKENVNLIFYSGQCQLLMGNFIKALQCFDLVCQRTDDALLISKSKAYAKCIKDNFASEALVTGGDELYK